MSDNISEAAAAAMALPRDAAKPMVDWARLLTQPQGSVVEDMGLCRVPMDASQDVAENALRKAIGHWLRFQTGRGWKLVSDVRVSRPGPTLDVRTGKVDPEYKTFKLTGMFVASQ